MSVRDFQNGRKSTSHVLGCGRVRNETSGVFPGASESRFEVSGLFKDLRVSRRT